MPPEAFRTGWCRKMSLRRHPAPFRRKRKVISMKEKILSLLKEAPGELSGEELSRTLGVSRAAVWKAIEQLRREGCEIAASPQAALKLAADTEDDKLWVIGGGSVYTALLCRCKRAYLTVIDAVAEGSDTFFPNLNKLPGWEIEEESEPMTENGLTFRFVTCEPAFTTNSATSALPMASIFTLSTSPFSNMR